MNPIKLYPYSEPTSTGRTWYVGRGTSLRRVAGPFEKKSDAVAWIKAQRSAS